MENSTKKQTCSKLDLLSAVEHIVELAKSSKLSPEFYKKAARYIKHLATRFNLTREQSVMFALFIDRSDDSHIQASELASHTECSTTRIIRYMNDIDELVRRDYIYRSKSSGRVSYQVPSEMIEALKKDEVYTPRNISGISCDALFCELARIVEKADNSDIDADTTLLKFKTLLEHNRHLVFVQKVLGYNLDDNDLALLLIFCHLFVDDDDDEVTFYNIDCAFDSGTMRNIKYELKRGINTLQEKGLVEWSNEGGMANREYYRLTMKAKMELLDELQLPSLTATRQSRNMLKSSDIKPRNLFYSSNVAHDIDELARLLDAENYNGIHARLQKQGFRCGFTCLFYGAPGTGKTETVLQLARRTGRDIMQVNIAEMKSCWVGESEKNIKALFDTYRQRVKESAMVPILLFNEADAIIGKRQEGAERAVEKMENSIQNIILQEMETLDGILIATTNLAQNMDKAFERRFLYKIRFDKPTVEARTAIWREMLPSLDHSDAAMLAERYDFSGGQIENIARHYAIDAILHGTEKPTIELLSEHCNNERISNTKNNRIGFAF